MNNLMFDTPAAGGPPDMRRLFVFFHINMRK
jgi:hypothetical protein